MNRNLIKTDDLLKLIQNIPGWKFEENRLRKSYKFPNFIKAFSFLTEVAIHAESLDHHPKITNVYNQVEIELWTHDADGITEFDLELATYGWMD
jgi:4a-hydroxytetrahydrobiopterin dehydratase